MTCATQEQTMRTNRQILHWQNWILHCTEYMKKYTLYTGCYVVNTKWYEHKPLAFVENECIKLLYSTVSCDALSEARTHYCSNGEELDHRYSCIEGGWESKGVRKVSRS